MSPHGDDITDLSAEEKKEETTGTRLSTEPEVLQTDKDNKNGNLVTSCIYLSQPFLIKEKCPGQLNNSYFRQNDVSLNWTASLSQGKRNNV